MLLFQVLFEIAATLANSLVCLAATFGLDDADSLSKVRHGHTKACKFRHESEEFNVSPQSDPIEFEEMSRLHLRILRLIAFGIDKMNPSV